MAQTAYEFSRFEAQPKTGGAPRVRVAKGSSRKSSGQVKKLMRTMVLASMVVALACGVLYTQTRITELQSQIARADNALIEERTLNSYLNGELEKMVNLRNIDDRAQELGLVKMDASKVNYVRVTDGEDIQVKKGAFEEAMDEVHTRFLGIFTFFD